MPFPLRDASLLAAISGHRGVTLCEAIYIFDEQHCMTMPSDTAFHAEDAFFACLGPRMLALIQLPFLIFRDDKKA
jgi:hypothetical protein